MTTKTTKSGRKATTTGRKASTVTTATTASNPAESAAAALAKRIARALTFGEGMDVSAVGVELATAETAREGAVESWEAKRKSADEAKAAADEASKALAAKGNLMARLAAELNPDLVPPKSGPAPKATAAVITAIVAATGQARPTVAKRVARWVAAGSLSLATGLDIHKAATTANTMLQNNGDAAAFWSMVTERKVPALASTAKPVRKVTVKATPKSVPVTAEEAAKVVAAARRETLAKATPAQTGAVLVRDLVNAVKALSDALANGSATLTAAQTTLVQTTLAVVPLPAPVVKAPEKSA